ncbi:recombinase family protein [Ahrensia marina]|uniref:recombinase family protein n=1 Tax=Ahrensia marina TaxID=1514904 RepID=UPI0035D0B35C
MKLSNEPAQYLIYARVSDIKQATDGDGLESQKHRCQKYVEQKGGIVAATFSDVFTGGGNYKNRSGVMEMLDYIDAHPKKRYILCFDDTKRFARDTEFFLKLFRELGDRGVVLECLNFKIDNSPEGIFILTMIVAQGELERKQNQRQVVQKMTARLEQGHWTFHAPAGYKFIRSSQGGKVMVRDEPLATFIADVLNRFANGSLQTQAEVKRELETNPLFPKSPRGEVYAYRVTRILTQPIYAGYVHMPSWDIPLREGQHEPLIDWKTFQRNKERLATGGHAPARKNISKDFPLRGHVECGDCGSALTSCYSQSKTGKRHPYYRCHNKNCVSYAKSIRKDKLEGEFEALLLSLNPAPKLFALAFELFKDGWEGRLSHQQVIRDRLRASMREKDKQIQSLLDRITKSENDSVIDAYEQRISALEEDRRGIAAEITRIEQPRGSFRELFELACEFLSNPWKLWDSGNLLLQRTVLKLAFAGRVAYHRENGFLNPKLSLPFKLLETIPARNLEMVGLEGLEPPTKRL